MAYAVPNYLKRDGESLLFNKDKQEFIFYVPEKYFTTSNAIVIGEYVQVFGLLDFMIVDDKGKPLTKMKRFNFPSIFTTRPYTIEKQKELTLSKYAGPQDYRLLKYKKDDKVVVSVMVEEDVETVEGFYKLLNRGNLPATIPYDELCNIYIENMRLSGNKYNITAQLFGLICSELYRSHKDINVPFRLAKENDMLAYQTISIVDAPKKVSPYVSLTSENWDNSVVGAIQVKDAKDSPLEPILTD